MPGKDRVRDRVKSLYRNNPAKYDFEVEGERRFLEEEPLSRHAGIETAKISPYSFDQSGPICVIFALVIHLTGA